MEGLLAIGGPKTEPTVTVHEPAVAQSGTVTDLVQGAVL